MEYNQIKTGADLRKYIMALLESRKKYPNLSTYLLQLWAVAERCKHVNRPDYALIARILTEAFESAPKQPDWAQLLKEPKIKEFESIPNTPEYHIEIRTYQAFEKVLRNQVVDLKLQAKFYPKYTSQWENGTVEAYLERGTANLEEETDLDEDITWFDLRVILNQGRYTE